MSLRNEMSFLFMRNLDKLRLKESIISRVKKPSGDRKKYEMSQSGTRPETETFIFSGNGRHERNKWQNLNSADTLNTK